MESSPLNITVKLSGKGETLPIETTTVASVGEVIDQIMTAKPDLDKEKINLVRKGRILKTDKILGKVGVADGDTINLVIKEATTEEEEQNPAGGMPPMFGGLPQFMGMPGMPGMGGMPGMPGMGGMPGMPGMGIPGMGMPDMGMGAPDASEEGAEGMSQMPPGFDPSAAGGMFNPEMMSNILDNPMVKGMISDFLSDPTKIQNILSANPILGQMAEGNPEIQDLINNPEKIKEHMTDSKLDEALAGVKDNLKNMDPSKMPGAPGMPPMGDTPAMTAGGPEAPDASSAHPGFGGMMGNMMGGIDQKTLNEMMAGFNVSPPSGADASTEEDYEGKTDEELKTLFKTQLETMSSMGFTDEATNIKTLKETKGDADLALQKLMGM